MIISANFQIKVNGLKWFVFRSYDANHEEEIATRLEQMGKKFCTQFSMVCYDVNTNINTSSQYKYKHFITHMFTRGQIELELMFNLQNWN